MISLDSNTASQATGLSSEQVRRIVQVGLEEDLGAGDLSASLFPIDATAQGIVLVKQDGGSRVWMGECHVYAGIRPSHIEAMQQEHPQAELLIHPECGCTTSFLYYDAAGDLHGKTAMHSTESMITHAARSPEREFIVATETGILHRLQKEVPGKSFYPASSEAVCSYIQRMLELS